MASPVGSRAGTPEELRELEDFRASIRSEMAGVAGEDSAPHRIYNLGNSRSELLEDFISVLEEACGRKAIRDYQPMQPGDAPATFADIARSEADLGFAPTTTIREGLPRFVAWYRDYHGV